MKKHIKYLILGVIMLLLSFKQTIAQNKYYKPKLLVYVVIDNMLEINVKDTNWFHKDICLKLKIDTINEYNILKFKNRKMFYYNGVICYKEQLYELKDINFVRGLKIIDNTVKYTYIEPPYCDNSGYCLSDKQKQFIKTIIERKNNKENIKIEVIPTIIDEKGKEYHYYDFGKVVLNYDIH
jgi:hypothetical protein